MRSVGDKQYFFFAEKTRGQLALPRVFIVWLAPRVFYGLGAPDLFGLYDWRPVFFTDWALPTCFIV